MYTIRINLILKILSIKNKMLIDKLKMKISNLETDLSTAKNQMYFLELIKLKDSKDKLSDEITLLNNNLQMMLEDLSEKNLRKTQIEKAYQVHQNLKILKKIFKSWNKYSKYRKHIIKKNPVILPEDIFKIILSFITIRHTEIVVKLLNPEKHGKPTAYLDQCKYGIHSWNIKIQVKSIIRNKDIYNDLKMEFLTWDPNTLSYIPFTSNYRKIKSVYTTNNTYNCFKDDILIGYTFKYRYKTYFIPNEFMKQLPHNSFTDLFNFL